MLRMSVSPSLSPDGGDVGGGKRRRWLLLRKLQPSLRYSPLQPGRLLTSRFPLLGVDFETRVVADVVDVVAAAATAAVAAVVFVVADAAAAVVVVVAAASASLG
jgi:hypothetical protein